MKKYLSTAFPHPTDSTRQIDIEAVLTMANATFINSLSSGLSQAQFQIKLNEEGIAYSIIDRPKRGGHS